MFLSGDQGAAWPEWVASCRLRAIFKGNGEVQAANFQGPRRPDAPLTKASLILYGMLQSAFRPCIPFGLSHVNSLTTNQRSRDGKTHTFWRGYFFYSISIDKPRLTHPGHALSPIFEL